MVKEIGEDKLNKRIQYAAERYSFDGKYDCNLTYWDNISNLVDRYVTKELW